MITEEEIAWRRERVREGLANALKSGIRPSGALMTEVEEWIQGNVSFGAAMMVSLRRLRDEGSVVGSDEDLQNLANLLDKIMARVREG